MDNLQTENNKQFFLQRFEEATEASENGWSVWMGPPDHFSVVPGSIALRQLAKFNLTWHKEMHILYDRPKKDKGN